MEEETFLPGEQRLPNDAVNCNHRFPIAAAAAAAAVVAAVAADVLSRDMQQQVMITGDICSNLLQKEELPKA